MYSILHTSHPMQYFQSQHRTNEIPAIPTHHRSLHYPTSALPLIYFRTLTIHGKGARLGILHDPMRGHYAGVCASYEA